MRERRRARRVPPEKEELVLTKIGVLPEERLTEAELRALERESEPLPVDEFMRRTEAGRFPDDDE